MGKMLTAIATMAMAFVKTTPRNTHARPRAKVPAGHKSKPPKMAIRMMPTMICR
jgi:hypothetical protein